MTEEYMTSAEIREKIAELKIRLAFQLEFEEELAKTLAECEEEDSEPTEQLTDREVEILRKIEAETRKRKSRTVGRRRTRRMGKIVAIAAILLMIGCGSALAAICGLVEAGILKFDVKVQEKGTIFELLRLENKVDVPEGWQGKYYPSYIPDGYELSYIKQSRAHYVDRTGKRFSFEENRYGDSRTVDTEDAKVGHVTLNGIDAMTVEKDGWIVVVWSVADSYFIVEANNDIETLLRIAASVVLIE